MDLSRSPTDHAPTGSGRRRAAAWRLLGTLGLLGLGFCTAEPPLPPLATGTYPIDGGQKPHRYRIDLEKGQYLGVSVTAERLDVAARLLRRGRRDDRQVAKSAGPYDVHHQVRELALVAERAGTYVVEVEAVTRGQSGRYALSVSGPRTASPADRLRAEAVRWTQRAVERACKRPEAEQRTPLPEGERTLKLWRSLGATEQEAALAYFLGTLHFEKGEHELAQLRFAQAIALRRRQGDREGLAEALNEDGRAARELHKPEEAVAQFEESARLFGEIPDRRAERAIVLSNLGGAYHELQNLDASIGSFQESLRLARSIQDRGIETTTLTHLGSAYQDDDQREEALEHYQKALEISREIKNPRTEIATLNNQADLYETLGELDKAVELQEQALALSRKHQETSERIRQRIPILLNNLGLIYQRLERDEDAENAYRQAIDRSERDNIKAQALANWALLDLRRHRPTTARERGERALALAGGQATIQAQAHQVIGAAELQLENLPAARSSLSTDLASDRGDLNRQAVILYWLARLEMKEENFDAALASIDAAIDKVESLRRRLTNPDLQAAYFASKQDIYQLKIDILMARDRVHPGRSSAGKALEVSEQARARSLREVLENAGADLQRGTAPDLLLRERRARQELIRRERELQQQLAEAGPLSSLEADRLREAAANLRQVEEAIVRSNSQYRSVVQPISLAAIQRDILDPGTLLLEYSLGEERSYLFAATRDTVESYELPPRREIDAVAKRLHDLLVEPNRFPPNEKGADRRKRIQRAEAEARQVSAALAKTLLLPVAPRLASHRLLVVSDGALQYIPFGLLPDPAAREPRFLIQGHEVVHLPSASVIPGLRAEITAHPRPPGELALFADPVFERDDAPLDTAAGTLKSAPSAPRRGIPAATAPCGSFDKLLFSRREADGIARLVPHDRLLMALGFAASKREALSGKLAGYRRLHFATHGVLDSRQPEQSSLVLSCYDAQGRPQDGFLRLQDIYGLDLNADLVVLSACETALGKQVRGEGLIGLTRGFMYAGAARVVASLWSVDDQATAELMKRFYRKMLTEKLPPAAALRQAQLSLLTDPEQKKWASPYYWAAFSFQGEWR
jgi:CHAT domain-containing protein/tetratricopeptide (TPR) repeat protein